MSKNMECRCQRVPKMMSKWNRISRMFLPCLVWLRCGKHSFTIAKASFLRMYGSRNYMKSMKRHAKSKSHKFKHQQKLIVFEPDWEPEVVKQIRSTRKGHPDINVKKFFPEDAQGVGAAITCNNLNGSTYAGRASTKSDAPR